MKYVISEEFYKALRQLVESLPYGQVKGVAVGFESADHCSPLVGETVEAE